MQKLSNITFLTLPKDKNENPKNKKTDSKKKNASQNDEQEYVKKVLKGSLLRNFQFWKNTLSEQLPTDVASIETQGSKQYKFKYDELSSLSMLLFSIATTTKFGFTEIEKDWNQNKQKLKEHLKTNGVEPPYGLNEAIFDVTNFALHKENTGQGRKVATVVKEVFSDFPQSRFAMPLLKEFLQGKFLEENTFATTNNLRMKNDIVKPYPFTIPKLLESQRIKRRSLERVYLADLKENQTLFVSENCGFPLFTYMRIFGSGSMSEELCLKLDYMSYKELNEKLILNLKLEELSTKLRKALFDPDPGLVLQKKTAEELLILQTAELLFYIESARWPGALLHNMMYLDLLKKNVNIAITDLPMSQPEVISKCVEGLRASVQITGPRWSYDYRKWKAPSSEQIRDVFSSDSDFKFKDHLFYFFGLELRLLILWRNHCIVDDGKSEKSLDENFVVECFHAVFRTEINENQREEKIIHSKDIKNFNKDERGIQFDAVEESKVQRDAPSDLEEMARRINKSVSSKVFIRETNSGKSSLVKDDEENKTPEKSLTKTTMQVETSSEDGKGVNLSEITSKKSKNKKKNEKATRTSQRLAAKSAESKKYNENTLEDLVRIAKDEKVATNNIYLPEIIGRYDTRLGEQMLQMKKDQLAEKLTVKGYKDLALSIVRFKMLYTIFKLRQDYENMINTKTKLNNSLFEMIFKLYHHKGINNN